MNRAHIRFAALLGTALTVGGAGCLNLDEDVVTGLTSTSYGTPAVFNALVNASYEPLRTFYGQERGFTVTVFGTDLFTKGADGSHKYINDYTSLLNPDAQFFRDTWNDFYRGINTANAALGQAAVVPIDSATKAHRVAEVRFLRALYYFTLVQMYGPLHLTLEETRTVSTEARRVPVDTIYEAILADLRAAAPVLPYVTRDYGRVSKGAVQHLLAKVYLTRLRDSNAVADEAAKLQAGDFTNAADYTWNWIDENDTSQLPGAPGTSPPPRTLSSSGTPVGRARAASMQG